MSRGRMSTSMVLSVSNVTVGSVVRLVFLANMDLWLNHTPDIHWLVKLLSWNDGRREPQGRRIGTPTQFRVGTAVSRQAHSRALSGTFTHPISAQL